MTADAAIVTEPTELEVVVAHKGFVWAEIVVEGVAAHGSRPDLGRDAITATAPVLERIRSLDETLTTRPEHPLLGRGSVHAGTITGGVETSSYPARCVVTVERRTLPGEDAATFAAELEGLPATIGLVRDPFAIDPEHELVGLVRNAAGGAERRRRGLLDRRRVHRGGRHPDGPLRPGRRGRPWRKRVGQRRLRGARRADAGRSGGRLLRLTTRPARPAGSAPDSTDRIGSAS